MLKNNKLYGIGIIFALLAAALNGSIGVGSKLLMESGLNSNDIAFFKTAIALIVASLICWIKNLKVEKIWWKIAICAFFGIFSLYFFETWAYTYGNAGDVVVLLMASAAISALILGRFLLKEKISLSAFIGTGFAIIGITLVSWNSGSVHYLMVFFSLFAGLGYGLFSVLIKKMSLKGGFALTRMLLFFGCIYLFPPYLKTAHTFTISVDIILGLVFLAIFPTMFGFYCTTKALNYLTAAKVQVTELSEPIFAIFLAWLLLTEIPRIQFWFGFPFILIGIILINGIFFKKN